jgi:quinol monooxygenase YgiN
MTHLPVGNRLTGYVERKRGSACTREKRLANWRSIQYSSTNKIAGGRRNQRSKREEAVKQDVFVRLHAREGEESAVEQALRDVLAPSREEQGCLSFHLFRSMRDRRLFYIHSRWRDQAAFQMHAELPHTVLFLERVDALLDQPRDVARTELIG